MSGKLPYSYVSERSVLGMLFFAPERLGEVASQLSSDDFWIGKHRSVWKAMLKVNYLGEEIDAASVWNYIDSGNNPHNVDVAFIGSLHVSEPTAEKMDTHIRIIKQKSALRKLAITTARISEGARDSPDDVPAFLAQSLEEVIEVTSRSVSGEPVSIREDITDMIAQAMDPNPVRDVRVESGIGGLDAMTGGLLNEQLNMVVARPDMGKTSLLSQIADGLCCTRRGPILWFSFEETIQQLQFIMVSRRCGIPYHALQMGRQMAPEITMAAAEVADLPIMIERQRMAVDGIMQRCMSFKGRHKQVGGIIIDHAALIPTSGKDDGFRAMYNVFTGLSAIPGRVGCPVVVAHQLNRNAHGRRPTMSDLRDAGEEPAKMIISPYRPCVYDENEPVDKMELLVLKNKGPKGVIDLTVDITCARIW